MSDIREGGRSATGIEELLPQATQVYINCAVDGQLELTGKGTPALAELVQRFEQRGIDAFNEAFITPNFEQSMENRIRILTDSIIGASSQGDAPDISVIRGQWDMEREKLEDVLRRIKRGEELLIPLKREANPEGRGPRFGKSPMKDQILIKLRKPSVSSVNQQNL